MSEIITEGVRILCISPYSVRMLENTDQNNPNMDNFYALTVNQNLRVVNHNIV